MSSKGCNKKKLANWEPRIFWEGLEVALGIFKIFFLWASLSFQIFFYWLKKGAGNLGSGGDEEAFVMV